MLKRSIDLRDHLKKIWILQLLSESRSQRDAAARAHVTPSAVSQAVSALEHVLGRTLMVREKNEFHVTSAGSELILNVKPALEILERIQAKGSGFEARNLRMRTVRMGAYESLAVRLLPHLIPVLRKVLPGLKWEIRTARSNILVREVKRGELELALAIEPTESRSLKIIPLLKDRFGIFISTKLMKLKEIQSLGEALKYNPLAGLAPGNDGYPSYYRRFLSGLKLKPNPTILSDSLEMLLELTTVGTVTSILPLQVARRAKSKITEIGLGEQVPDSTHRVCLLSREGIDSALQQAVVESFRGVYSSDLITL